MTTNHDKPMPKVQYSAPKGNMNKGPMPASYGVTTARPSEETGAGVPAPGTYAPGTGPTVRPEWTGNK